MKPIKKTKSREELAAGPPGGVGRWLLFSVHELGAEIRKTRTIYSKHDHSGLLKRLTVFERLPYIIYDFLGI